MQLEPTSLTRFSDIVKIHRAQVINLVAIDGTLL